MTPSNLLKAALRLMDARVRREEEYRSGDLDIQDEGGPNQWKTDVYCPSPLQRGSLCVQIVVLRVVCKPCIATCCGRRTAGSGVTIGELEVVSEATRLLQVL